MCFVLLFFLSSRRRHTRCALVTGVQTCALPILWSADNWTFGGAVGANDPNNDGANQFSVSIDGSAAVSSGVTLHKNVTIDRLAVDENDSLVVSPGFGLTIPQNESRPSRGTPATTDTITLPTSDSTEPPLRLHGEV